MIIIIIVQRKKNKNIGLGKLLILGKNIYDFMDKTNEVRSWDIRVGQGSGMKKDISDLHFFSLSRFFRSGLSLDVCAIESASISSGKYSLPKKTSVSEWKWICYS